MTSTLLSNEQHQDVRVDTRARAEYGDLVNRAVVLSSEFNEAHKEFPILLHKQRDTGEVAAHAILGFDQDENLFVENDLWTTQYVPASIARGPFSLGYVRRGDGGESEAVDIRVIIDEDSPRLKADGQPVFLELGGESPYLEGIKAVLQIVDAGMQVDKVFYPQLLDMDLLEQVNIRVTLSAEKQYEFADYYTINQPRLMELTAEQLLILNRAGTLGLIYFLISSMGNFQRLINLKNARSDDA